MVASWSTLRACLKKLLLSSSQLSPWGNAGTLLLDCFQKKARNLTVLCEISWFLNVGSNSKIVKTLCWAKQNLAKAWTDLENASVTLALGHSQPLKICIQTTPNHYASTAYIGQKRSHCHAFVYHVSLAWVSLSSSLCLSKFNIKGQLKFNLFVKSARITVVKINHSSNTWFLSLFLHLAESVSWWGG